MMCDNYPRLNIEAIQKHTRRNIKLLAEETMTNETITFYRSEPVEHQPWPTAGYVVSKRGAEPCGAGDVVHLREFHNEKERTAALVAAFFDDCDPAPTIE